MYKSLWYCRWCGKITDRKKTDRDGFCDNNGKCKQAHYRAYKKYRENVTNDLDLKPAESLKSNAKKKIGREKKCR